MDDSMTYVSALQHHLSPGMYSVNGETRLSIRELSGLRILQIATWPSSISHVEKQFENLKNIGSDSISMTDIFRVDPLRWWRVQWSSSHPVKAVPDLADAHAMTLDVSEGWAVIECNGSSVTEWLNRHIAIDLRPSSFPVGSFVSTHFHHAGIKIANRVSGVVLFLPRGFAASLTDLLCESAAPFGYSVEVDTIIAGSSE